MPAPSGFLNTRLGATGMPVFRLGLSATYRPGEHAVRAALDQGVNYLFCFAIDTQMSAVIRSLNADRRERVVVATGGYNWIFWRTNLRKSLENALRRLRTGYIDVFHYLGIMNPGHFPPRVQDELMQLKAEGRIRATAVSCHDRTFAGELAQRGAVDVLMIRYNAVHPGAERDIFPYVSAHGTGVVSYTATRWGRLLTRPRGWPRNQPIAAPGQCYRFALSNPNVHVVLMAPASEKQLLENLREAQRGPLPEDEMAFMRRFGAFVHGRAGWFMGR
ncbi:MAG TPA: aldo/keto reductase [Bryobacteraceae bacterium]|nr:aldo/keto reductase [Bryobacteraceae bacterium]HOL70339.1 aldo/keto reductase [Bryobacteraceae bacterium]HOQ47979.1 aldo/keto reductase [Bryobacteraceae bacterium]HPU72557.1 aldo/keto reductase [Bryobacteraceae bacterium]